MNLFTHRPTDKIKPLAFALCLGIAAVGMAMSPAHATTVDVTWEGKITATPSTGGLFVGQDLRYLRQVIFGEIAAKTNNL